MIIMMLFNLENLRCPVATFAKYLLKLNPSNPSLWQRPKKNVLIEDDVWYDNSSLGHNTLGKMMDTMSREARLSKIYSNHCLKGTHASVLNDPTLQNSMLLIKTKLVSGINGHPFPKIVPKPTSNLSVIPCVPIAPSASTAPTVTLSNQNNQIKTMNPTSNNNNIVVLSTHGQMQTTPLNTPLQNSTAASSNSIQIVTLAAPMQNQMIIPPTMVSTYGSLPFVVR
jgi:hypothetical protein